MKKDQEDQGALTHGFTKARNALFVIIEVFQLRLSLNRCTVFYLIFVALVMVDEPGISGLMKELMLNPCEDLVYHSIVI
jgi:hypothetical protein